MALREGREEIQKLFLFHWFEVSVNIPIQGLLARACCVPFFPADTGRSANLHYFVCMTPWTYLGEGRRQRMFLVESRIKTALRADSTIHSFIHPSIRPLDLCPLTFLLTPFRTLIKEGSDKLCVQPKLYTYLCVPANSLIGIKVYLAYMYRYINHTRTFMHILKNLFLILFWKWWWWFSRLVRSDSCDPLDCKWLTV